MRVWIAAAVVFFGYLVVVIPLVPRLGRPARLRAAAGAVAGLLISTAAHVLPPVRILHHALLPLLLLVTAYWTGGLLFVAPMPRVERALASLDRALQVGAAARATPRWVAELLELAYCGVYPLIPLALPLYLSTPGPPGADSFWAVILVTDFICFACLPWIQTRPPRAFSTTAPWAASLRRVNLLVLGRASIQVNTFPSGHAAAAFAVALLLSGAAPPLAAGAALVALLVSAGAVLGRYHYFADALAGWLVALVVWLALAA